MPTVIDSLIVELGLDPSKFTKGQKEAAASFARTKEEARSSAKDFEHQAGQVSEVFSRVRNSVLKVTSVLLGGFGAYEFAQHFTKLHAETGRTAYTLDSSSKQLSSWRGAAILAGGSAEGLTNSVQGLVSQFQTWSLTGESSVIPYFRALGINITDAGGRMRNWGDILLDLSEKFKGLDPAKAAAFGHALGFDQGTINLLIQGRDIVAAMIGQQEKLGIVTEADAVAGASLARAWGEMEQKGTSLGRGILTWLTPALVTSLTLVTRSLSWLSSDAGKSSAIDFASISSGGTFIPSDAPATGSKDTLGGVVSGISGALEKAAIEGYIVEAAKKRGIDPNIALAVARSEGLNKYVGDQGSSFGPYQLHYGNVAKGGNSVGGLGDKFTKQTGLNANDPSTVRQQIDFALDEAAKGGWTPWHGWKGSAFAGITPGFNAATTAGGSVNSNSASTHNETKIDRIIVHTQARDADGIAKSIGPAIERNSLAAQANYGSN